MFGEKIVSSLNTKIEFLPYSSKYYQQTIEVIRQSFFQYETVSVASEININLEAQKDLEGLCVDALNKSDVSVVARDVEKDKIVGVAINVIQNKQLDTDGELSYFEKYRDNCCKTKNAKSLMNYMIEADSRVDVFEIFNINSLMEIMFIAVLPEYGRQGIGYDLCKYSIDIAKNLNIKLITALWTGRNTQVIGRKLGFDVVYEESFNKFSFNGKTFAERVQDENLTYHVGAKKIN